MSTTPVGLCGVSLSFGSTSVLRNLDLTIAPGAFVALLGRSGSGKTTLLRVLADLESPTSGTVHAPQARSVVFQEPRLLPWKRVWQNVMIGLPARDAYARARAALREVEVDHRIDAWPLTLSGGEAQRVSLARALVRKPELLLLDEPFAALDALTRLRMHALVLDLWRMHTPTLLLVTHDVDEAILLADRAVVLEDGRVAADISIEAVRPRDPTSPAFAALRRALLVRLGVAPFQSDGFHSSTPALETR